MRLLIIRALSILALIVAVVWFIDGGGYEAVITALVGLAGLFSGEILKTGETKEAPSGMESDSIEAPPPRAIPESAGKDSVLVLPFDNISPDPDNAYFSDGLTEEVITTLSRLKSLRVISRNSAMSLKGTGKDTRTIAEELGVQYVLQGSVRKAGNALRISAHLTHAASDENLWAEKYEGELVDVFGIQEEVSRAIVNALTLTLSPEEDEQLTERPFEDPRAYDCFLRARQQYWKMTPESLEEAHRQVQNGIQLVGENELLLATLGYVSMQRISFGMAAAPEHLPEAERLAGEVFELNEDSVHGHTLLGWIRFSQGRPSEAVFHLKEAHRREPEFVEANVWLVITYLSAGKEARAAPYVHKLLEIDPLTPANHSLLAYWHVLRRENRQALDAYQRMYEMDPQNPFTAVLFGRMLVMLGEKDRGRHVLEGIAEVPAESPILWQGRILLHLLRGDDDQAAAAITPALEEASQYDEHLAWWLADWYAALGREEEAVSWLRHAGDLGFFSWPILSEIDPFLDPIRHGAEFQRYLEEVRVRWEGFEA